MAIRSIGEIDRIENKLFRVVIPADKLQTIKMRLNELHLREIAQNSTLAHVYSRILSDLDYQYFPHVIDLFLVWIGQKRP